MSYLHGIWWVMNKLINNLTKGYTMTKVNLKEQYGRPSEFALTLAMEGIKNEIIKLKEQIDNEEIVGDKKKYLQALFNLNNKMIADYDSKGGDATGYHLEFEEDKNDPLKIWNWIY
tara:strand:- start:827 stop:1174 length:348 start_codon:yes stop_codon:yes gene_type:complete